MSTSGIDSLLVRQNTIAIFFTKKLKDKEEMKAREDEIARENLQLGKYQWLSPLGFSGI